MKETEQLKKLMEAIDTASAEPKINENKTSDMKADKMDKLEAKLDAAGYTRIKDTSRSEYQFKWVKDGSPTYVVNYRFGTNGYEEYWIEK